MEKRNLVIIGSGPAGLTAAIYAARANLHPLVFEGFMAGISGGQLMTTTDVENFPGFPQGILGPELIEQFREQAMRFSSQHLMEDVVSIDLVSHPFIVNGNQTKVSANALIIATGASARRLDIPGGRDGEFWQKGVSACAICDGAAPIFREREIFVIGGGDSATEEAIFLTKYASHVYIVHRRDELRASKIMAQRAMNHPKITILWNREIIQILGNDIVREVVLQDVVTKKKEKRKAGGVFFAIGHQPNVEFLNEQLELNENGYIMVKKGTSQTSKEGVFAAGDVQDFRYRQAITAAGSGCIAALDAERWLSEKGFVGS